MDTRPGQAQLAVGARRSGGMGDQHAGGAGRAHLLDQQLEHRAGGDRVEVAGRLVGQDQRRRCTTARAIATRCNCPPDSCAGMRAARPWPGRPAASSVRPRAPGPGGPAASAAAPRSRPRSGAAARGRPGTRSPAAGAATGRRCRRRRGEIEAVDLAACRVGAVQPGDAVEQRRLADARLAQQRDESMERSQVSCRLASWRVAAMPRSRSASKASPLSSAPRPGGSPRSASTADRRAGRRARAAPHLVQQPACSMASKRWAMRSCSQARDRRFQRQQRQSPAWNGGCYGAAARPTAVGR
jgi:hypothetical protein